MSQRRCNTNRNGTPARCEAMQSEEREQISAKAEERATHTFNCGNPACRKTNTVDRRGRGRLPKFCKPACRDAAYRAAKVGV